MHGALIWEAHMDPDGSAKWPRFNSCEAECNAGALHSCLKYLNFMHVIASCALAPSFGLVPAFLGRRRTTGTDRRCVPCAAQACPSLV